MIKLAEELRIHNVGEEWGKIKTAQGPVEIDLSDVKSVDGAGFQLVLFCLHLERDLPQTYQVKGMNNELEESLSEWGYYKH